MKRNLVVTSSTTIATSEPDTDIALAGQAERQRLEAYLYGNSTLVAVVHESGPITTAVDGKRTYRVTQRALVTVEGSTPADARYLADYQAGRLQSGSFGVEDFVEDIDAARRAVGVVEEPEVTVSDALDYAISVLDSEVVLGSLGLDGDFEFGYSTITENGVEREYTEDDQAREIARHNQIINLLRDLLSNVNYEVK